MAFRPATQKTYNSMFRLVLAFLVFMNIQMSKVSPLIILAYLQFLEFSDFHHQPWQITYHLSIKTTFSLYGLSTQPFADPRIKCFQKVMVLHKLFKVQLKKVIDIPTLQLIVRLCDTTYMGQVFKAVYTVAFFSFLRLSNLVPHSQLYSPLYQLARGHVISPHAPYTSKMVKNIAVQKCGKSLKNSIQTQFAQ